MLHALCSTYDQLYNNLAQAYIDHFVLIQYNSIRKRAPVTPMI